METPLLIETLVWLWTACATLAFVFPLARIKSPLEHAVAEPLGGARSSSRGSPLDEYDEELSDTEGDEGDTEAPGRARDTRRRTASRARRAPGATHRLRRVATCACSPGTLYGACTHLMLAWACWFVAISLVWPLVVDETAAFGSQNPRRGVWLAHLWVAMAGAMAVLCVLWLRASAVASPALAALVARSAFQSPSMGAAELVARVSVVLIAMCVLYGILLLDRRSEAGFSGWIAPAMATSTALVLSASLLRRHWATVVPPGSSFWHEGVAIFIAFVVFAVYEQVIFERLRVWLDHPLAPAAPQRPHTPEPAPPPPPPPPPEPERASPALPPEPSLVAEADETELAPLALPAPIALPPAPLALPPEPSLASEDAEPPELAPLASLAPLAPVASLAPLAATEAETALPPRSLSPTDPAEAFAPVRMSATPGDALFESRIAADPAIPEFV
jgi:hypothetical protein